jgi:hypothetical protein
MARPSDFDKQEAIRGGRPSPPLNPPDLSHIHPHTPFTYSHLTEPDNLTDPEREKDAKWCSSKSLRILQITIDLAWKDWLPEKSKANARKKIDHATVKQVRQEFVYQQYHNHNLIKFITTVHPKCDDENRPVTKNKQGPDAQQHSSQKYEKRKH